MEAGVNRDKDDEYVCTKERADFLVDHDAVIIIEEIKEESKKEIKPKTTKKSSKK